MTESRVDPPIVWLQNIYFYHRGYNLRPKEILEPHTAQNALRNMQSQGIAQAPSDGHVMVTMGLGGGFNTQEISSPSFQWDFLGSKFLKFTNFGAAPDIT